MLVWMCCTSARSAVTCHTRVTVTLQFEVNSHKLLIVGSQAMLGHYGSYSDILFVSKDTSATLEDRIG